MTRKPMTGGRGAAASARLAGAAAVVALTTGVVAACGTSPSRSGLAVNGTQRTSAPATTGSGTHRPTLPAAAAPASGVARSSTTPAGVSAVPSSMAPSPAVTAPSPAVTSTAAPTATPRTPATTAPPISQTAACPPTLAGELASPGSGTQVVTVEAADGSTTVATVTAWQRSGGCWVVAGGPWSGHIGANGFSDHRREGDDTTPTGAYAFGPVMYGNAADPGVAYAYHQLVCGDWWDEDPTSAEYNTFQHVSCGQAPPFGGGSEALWEEQAPYPSFAVIEYNPAPAVPGAGSAIFLHADTAGPTAGCVSIPVSDLDQVLRWLQPSANPTIVMGPAAEITSF